MVGETAVLSHFTLYWANMGSLGFPHSCVSHVFSGMRQDKERDLEEKEVRDTQSNNKRVTEPGECLDIDKSAQVRSPNEKEQDSGRQKQR